MAEHESQTTTDHDAIRKWAEQRGGVPATVKSTSGQDDPAGILRIHFPDYSEDQDLEKISWDAFFEKFDQGGLAFLYQEKTKDGKESRFFKLVSR